MGILEPVLLHAMAVPTVTTDAAQPKVYPSVTVIVPIYNGEADVPALVEGLLGQDYPADRVEYLLVDNGSSDRTPDLLQAAAANAASQGINLRALTYSAIQSSYAARNAGIVVATGEILAFTDDDCHPEPGWLTALVQPFSNSSVGLVAGAIEALPSQNWLERYADRQGTLSQRNTLNHPFLPYGQTANLAIRAEILGTVGLFRPHLTTGGDADLCWRIQQATDQQLVYAAEAVVYHRHRDSLKDLRSQWYRYGCSNHYLHDLHGVALGRSLTAKETAYRLLRWGLKELPQATVKLLTGRGTALELAITPLDLWCARARSQGQAQAQLSDDARTIAHRGKPT
jgi:glycosyltransferase involved in cell wall biosynthesis